MGRYDPDDQASGPWLYAIGFALFLLFALWAWWKNPSRKTAYTALGWAIVNALAWGYWLNADRLVPWITGGTTIGIIALAFSPFLLVFALVALAKLIERFKELASHAALQQAADQVGLRIVKPKEGLLAFWNNAAVRAAMGHDEDRDRVRAHRLLTQVIRETEASTSPNMIRLHSIASENRQKVQALMTARELDCANAPAQSDY